jgi:hypothetical protein
MTSELGRSPRVREPSVSAEAPDLISEGISVLGLVNTLQPVGSDFLLRAFEETTDADELGRLLAWLHKNKLIRKLPNGEYVASLRGRSFLQTGPFAKESDVARMQYLFERSKGGREPT